MEKQVQHSKYYKEDRIRSRMNAYIRESNKEYDIYKKDESNTRDLALAGEKLWRAFNFYMELKAGKSLRSVKEVSKAVHDTNDTNLEGIYDKAYSLHQFFYGWVDRIEDMTERYEQVDKGLKYYIDRGY